MSSTSATATTTTPLAPSSASPSYKTLSPPSYVDSTSKSDAHSLVSSTTSSKTLLAKMWNKKSSSSSPPPSAAAMQAKVAEKQIRAEARMSYFSMM